MPMLPHAPLVTAASEDGLVGSDWLVYVILPVLLILAGLAGGYAWLVRSERPRRRHLSEHELARLGQTIGVPLATLLDEAIELREQIDAMDEPPLLPFG